jgi:hypothetical protein
MTRRRRQCVDGHRFTTYEITAQDLTAQAVGVVVIDAHLTNQGLSISAFVETDIQEKGIKKMIEKTALEKVTPKNEALQTLPDRPMALMPQTFEQMIKVAEVLSKSGLVPKVYQGKPADVFGAMQYGAELGMMPFAAIRNIDMIDGSPSLRARAAMGVCVAERDCDSFVEATAPDDFGGKSVWICTRKGVAYRGEFSIDQAKQAGLLGKNNWKNYPVQMLENRAIAYAARKAYPDKLSGVYTPDEVLEMVQVSPNVFSTEEFEPPASAQVADVVDVKGDEGTEGHFESLKRKISNCTTREDLEGLIGECRDLKALSPQFGDRILSVYTNHRSMIDDAAKIDEGS